MIIKDLVITNNQGASISFGQFFKISDDFNLSGLNATVNYSESTGDGSNYQNTKLNNRDFDIPFFIHRTVTENWWIEDRRNEAYRIFNPKKNPFRIDITTKSGEKYFLNANLEAAPSFPIGFENTNKEWQKGLLQFSSNDPFLYRNENQVVHITSWQGAFSFPLEIPVAGIQMGIRSTALSVNVFNNGQEETGVNLVLKATGAVVNPSITNIRTFERFKLNMTMQAGDVIEVSTYKGKKKVMLTRANVTTSIFNLVDIQSSFLKLDVGDNVFTYAADSGSTALEISVSFTPRLLGV